MEEHRSEKRRRFRTALKWVGIGFAIFIALVAALFGYVAATFDPNDYKARIVEAVKARTGRTLELTGDIALTLWPSIGAKLGRASLSEPGGAREFASVESAVVSVKVMPLLAREVIVDAVEVSGLRLNVERDRKGRMNFDDLAGPAKAEEPAKAEQPVQVDIARIEIDDADVSYTDHGAGTRYRLAKLDLETGRIAGGVATPVEMRATVASDKDRAQLDVRLDTRFTPDFARNVYKLESLDLAVSGALGGLTAMKASVKGNLEIRTERGEYLAQSLTMALEGRRNDGDVEVKLDAPRLTLTRDKVEGARLALEARLVDAKGKIGAKASIGGVQGAFNAVKAGPLEVDIDAQGERRAYKAQLTGALNADLDRKSAALNFSGKIDDSNVNGKAAISRYSPLAATFMLHADHLDADRLLGQGAAGAAPQKAGQTPARGADGDRIDLSGLEGIDVAGDLRVGKLTLLNLKSADVRASVKVAGGRLDVSPITAQLYDGRLDGALSAQAAANPVFTVRQRLMGVSVGPLLRDAAQIDTLEGRGSVSADLTTRGATVDALKKALNGTASVNLADGAVKGMDVAGTIRTARTRLRQLQGKTAQASNKAEKTDFTELKASFRVKNGVARNDDLSLKSPLLRIAGAGDIDIGNDRLDYLLQATLVATSKGQGGRDAADLAGITVPVKLAGALEAPQWSIDFAGMAATLARDQLKAEILERIPGKAGGSTAPRDAREAIKDRLKGILGR